MRIAVANLTSGGLSGGYRKYLARLMPLMAQDPRVRELTVFVPPGAAVEIDRSVNVRSWSTRPWRGLKDVAREIARTRPDVVFVPTARYAGFGGIPVVTMVRNMEPLMVPFGGNSWTEAVKNIARAREARRACRRASRVIAVSNHVRDFLVTRWGTPEDRVATVYHGVDRVAAEIPSGATFTARTLLTAGSIRPARGLEDVIRALPLLDPDVRLVIAGRVDPGCDTYAARLRALAIQHGMADRITWAGELSGSEMLRAFLDAGVFVMTSRAEACPNVALEAMSCGCASVSVEHAPMPEFFADAARYYPAGQPAVLARQLRALLGDQAERDRLGSNARRHAAAFTWQRTLDSTIQELERALA